MSYYFNLKSLILNCPSNAGNAFVLTDASQLLGTISKKIFFRNHFIFEKHHIGLDDGERQEGRARFFDFYFGFLYTVNIESEKNDDPLY